MKGYYGVYEISTPDDEKIYCKHCSDYVQYVASPLANEPAHIRGLSCSHCGKFIKSKVIERQYENDFEVLNNGWQQMNTAPQDGTSILAYISYNREVNSMVIINSIGENKWYFSFPAEEEEDVDWFPIYWMPLPEPPKNFLTK